MGQGRWSGVGTGRFRFLLLAFSRAAKGPGVDGCGNRPQGLFPQARHAPIGGQIDLRASGKGPMDRRHPSVAGGSIRDSLRRARHTRQEYARVDRPREALRQSDGTGSSSGCRIRGAGGGRRQALRSDHRPCSEGSDHRHRPRESGPGQLEGDRSGRQGHTGRCAGRGKAHAAGVHEGRPRGGTDRGPFRER